jgi:hypothetical protein
MQLTARVVSTLLLSILVVISIAALPLGSAQYYYSQCNVNAVVNYPSAGYITPGTGYYNYGSTVVFTEQPYLNYSFNGWYVNGIYEGKLCSISLTMTQNYQLVAVFSVQLASLTITSSPSQSGTIAPGAGVWNYTYGTTVAVMEYPNSGATFSGWYLDGIYMGAGTSLPITMNQDHQLNVFFSGGNNITSPTPTAAPAPTPNPNLLSPDLQFYCTSSTTASGFNVGLQGGLFYDSQGITDAGILFSYSVTNGATWQNLAYVKTGYYGNFSAIWMPSASGDYLVRAVYLGDNVYSSAVTTVNFAVQPLQNQNQNVFSVTSNSTLTNLAYDSSHNSLSFGVSGDSGTIGYAQICIPKSLLPNVATLQISLDNSIISYSSFSNGNVWLITIYYHHSSHNIVMALTPAAATSTPTTSATSSQTTSSGQTSTSAASSSTSSTSTPAVSEFTLALLPISLAIIGSLAVLVMLKKRGKVIA